MKIALIGTGKTGQQLLQGHNLGILSSQDVVIPFNSSNPPTEQSLKGADVVVVFVPGDVALELVPLILKSRLPCAWGSTGFHWPEKDLDNRLKKEGVPWIRASNFSLGMGIIKHLLKGLKEALPLFSSPNPPYLHMVETHHTKKKDAPSGTSLLWKEWLGLEIPIESKREGDTVGIHELVVSAENEIITIKHEALDRKLFAQGAYWAANQLHKKLVPPGLFTFDQVMELYLERKHE